MAIQIFESSDWHIRTMCHAGEVLFRAGDISRCLGFSNPRRAIRAHVWEQDRKYLGNLVGGASKDTRAVYITEQGVYALIFASEAPAALAFREWVCKTLFPNLRKGNIAQSQPPLSLRSEADLHHKVVDFIRRFYPEALLAPGLGELQDSKDKRSYGYHCGYKGGQPDILILNHHAKYSGFAIELKHPDGHAKLSDKQVTYLEQLRRASYKTLVTHDYDRCIKELIEYFQHVRLCCSECKRKFKSNESLVAHLTHFHKHS